MIDSILLISALAWANPNGATEAARKGLMEAAATARGIEHCAAQSSTWEAQRIALMARFFEAQDRVESFLGAGVAPAKAAVAAVQAPPSCNDGFVNETIAASEGALARVDQVSEGLEAATGKGAWLGLFPVCEALSARVTRDQTGDLAVRVQLEPTQAETFTAYRDLFLPPDGRIARMALRLNGATLARPGVYGASHVSVLMLPVKSRAEAAAMAQSASADCGV